MWYRKARYIMMFSGLLALGACDVIAGPEDSSQISLSVAVAQNGAATVAARDIIQGQDGLELVLTRVAIVLRDIELTRKFRDQCLDGLSGDACERFSVGPAVFEVPMDGSVDQILVADVPPDTYEELRFEIHRLSGDRPEAREILEKHPELAETSVLVVGTFNGEPFEFRETLSEVQRVEFDTPLVVEEGSGSTNLTLTLDLADWFLDSKGRLLDPRTIGESSDRDRIRENIRRSLRAFEDSDRDGRDRNNDGGDGG